MSREAGMLRFIYEHATPVRVIDGDTVVILVDHGFGLTQKITVRVRGIDAPELNTAEGKAAREFVKQILESKPVVVHSHSWDKYGGRVVGDVYVDGISLAGKLVDAGLARWMI